MTDDSQPYVVMGRFVDGRPLDEVAAGLLAGAALGAGAVAL